jgi:hypothetical protein
VLQNLTRKELALYNASLQPSKEQKKQLEEEYAQVIDSIKQYKGVKVIAKIHKLPFQRDPEYWTISLQW